MNRKVGLGFLICAALINVLVADAKYWVQVYNNPAMGVKMDVDIQSIVRNGTMMEFWVREYGLEHYYKADCQSRQLKLIKDVGEDGTEEFWPNAPWQSPGSSSISEDNESMAAMLKYVCEDSLP